MINIESFIKILAGNKVSNKDYYVFSEEMEIADFVISAVKSEVVKRNWGSVQVNNKPVFFCRMSNYSKLLESATLIAKKKRNTVKKPLTHS